MEQEYWFINEKFLNKEGKCVKSMFTRDGLHLSKKGMATLVQVYLDKLTKPKLKDRCFSGDVNREVIETDICINDC